MACKDNEKNNMVKSPVEYDSPVPFCRLKNIRNLAPSLTGASVCSVGGTVCGTLAETRHI